MQIKAPHEVSYSSPSLRGYYTEGSVVQGASIHPARRKWGCQDAFETWLRETRIKRSVSIWPGPTRHRGSVCSLPCITCIVLLAHNNVGRATTLTDLYKFIQRFGNFERELFLRDRLWGFLPIAYPDLRHMLSRKSNVV